MANNQPNMTLRYYFSTEALVSAYKTAKISQKIIDDHQDLKEPVVDIDYASSVTNTIINSVIFMEATINEFFLDIYQAPNDSLLSVNNLGTKAIRRIKDYLMINDNFIKSESILSKYNLALFILEKDKLQPGNEPYQSANDLICFRNELVHYKIVTINSLQSESSTLEKRLQSKFALHPLSQGLDSIYYPFPRSHFSHDCAKWAINSSRKFVQDFFDRINLQPVYLNPISQLEEFINF